MTGRESDRFQFAECQFAKRSFDLEIDGGIFSPDCPRFYTRNNSSFVQRAEAGALNG